MLVVTVPQLATKRSAIQETGWFEGKGKELPFTPTKFEMPMAGLNEIEQAEDSDLGTTVRLRA